MGMVFFFDIGGESKKADVKKTDRCFFDIGLVFKVHR